MVLFSGMFSLAVRGCEQMWRSNREPMHKREERIKKTEKEFNKG